MWDVFFGEEADMYATHKGRTYRVGKNQVEEVDGTFQVPSAAEIYVCEGAGSSRALGKGNAKRKEVAAKSKSGKVSKKGEVIRLAPKKKGGKKGCK